MDDLISAEELEVEERGVEEKEELPDDQIVMLSPRTLQDGGDVTKINLKQSYDMKIVESGASGAANILNVGEEELPEVAYSQNTLAGIR